MQNEIYLWSSGKKNIIFYYSYFINIHIGYYKAFLGLIFAHLEY